MKQIFKEGFRPFVCVGDTITAEWEGFIFTAIVEYDPHMKPHDLDAPGCCYDTKDPEYGKSAQEIIATWEKDEWFYCGIRIDLEDVDGWVKEGAATLWGVDCNFPARLCDKSSVDNKYLTEVANELANEALDVIEKRKSDQAPL